MANAETKPVKQSCNFLNGRRRIRVDAQAENWFALTHEVLRPAGVDEILIERISKDKNDFCSPFRAGVSASRPRRGYIHSECE
jgi:hypothetical protein